MATEAQIETLVTTAQPLFTADDIKRAITKFSDTHPQCRLDEGAHATVLALQIMAALEPKIGRACPWADKEPTC